jgi:hypothetical protein
MVKWVKRVFLSLTPQTHYNVPKKHYNVRVNVIPSVLSVVSHGVSALVALGIALHGFVVKKRTKKLSFTKLTKIVPKKKKKRHT